MGPIEDLFIWIAQNFTSDVYLVSTKVQGLIWSTADIILLVALFRIVSLLRERAQAPPIRWRYGFLMASAVLTPFLAFTDSSRQFLILESIICGIQFMLLVYTVITEKGKFLDLVKELGADRAP